MKNPRFYKVLSAWLAFALASIWLLMLVAVHGLLMLESIFYYIVVICTLGIILLIYPSMRRDTRSGNGGLCPLRLWLARLGCGTRHHDLCFDSHFKREMRFMDARSACFWSSSPADCVRMVQFTDGGFLRARRVSSGTENRCT